MSVSGVAVAASPAAPGARAGKVTRPDPRTMTFGEHKLETERLVPPVIVLTGARRMTSRLIQIRAHFLDALLKSTEDLAF